MLQTTLYISSTATRQVIDAEGWVERGVGADLSEGWTSLASFLLTFYTSLNVFQLDFGSAVPEACLKLPSFMLDRLYAAFAGLLVLLWLCVAVSCSFFLWQDRKDKRILVEACAALVSLNGLYFTSK